MKFTIAGHTDRGGREHNEDAVDWLIGPERDYALALVADGMGGYSGGEVASTLALEVFLHQLRPSLVGLASADSDTVLATLMAGARAAQQRLLAEQRSQPDLARMGTTLLCGFAWQDQLVLLHAGDSRCYRWRANVLSRLSRDHTFVEDMLERGEISALQAQSHPRRHVLTRALGAQKSFDFSVAIHRLVSGDRYVFCSDGVSNALTKGDWGRVLKAGADAATSARLLIETAKQREANDNVSAVLLVVS